MLVLKDIPSFRALVAEQRGRGKTIGVVPTMGALHQGHLSLVAKIKEHCDFVIMWIFVNPIQFNSKQDLLNYPRELTVDCEKAKAAGVDVVFAPSVSDIYPQGEQAEYGPCKVIAGHFSKGLCGATRPGHFDGVVTVVSIFFNIIEPDVAVFGDKDYQQLAVIRQMVRDLHLPVEILAAPLLREEDGLALSSRNQLLAEEERERALHISAVLFESQRSVTAGERDAAVIRSGVVKRLEVAGLRVDYVEVVDTETLEPVERIKDRAQLMVAAFAGGVRLIDNVKLQVGGESV